MADAGAGGGHAFISYIHEDAARADELQEMLLHAGVPVWRDTVDLMPGEDWRMVIRQAISEESLVFLACFSRAGVSREKTYQNEELVLAVEQLRLRKPGDPWLIPVRFDDCQIPDFDLGAGRTLASVQRADLFGNQRDSQAARLVASVQRILGRRSGGQNRSGLVPAAGDPGPGTGKAGPADLSSGGSGVFRLVDALLAVEAFADEGQRTELLRLLPAAIANAVPRHSVPRVQALAMLRTCMAYPHGLRELLDAIRLVEPDSLHRQRLDDTAASIFPEMLR
jgi:hypothetical protein